MKTVEDVKLAVGAHGITRWKLRECSICNYPLCYLFKNGRVFFDTGCDCTRQSGGAQERSYADVAHVFNIQTPEVSESMWQEFTQSGVHAF